MQMIYSPAKAAVVRRDMLISGLRDSQRFMVQSMNRQADELTDWLRQQIEKRETRMDTIGLIGKAGCGELASEAAKTAGEAAAFREVLNYIENGRKAE